MQLLKDRIRTVSYTHLFIPASKLAAEYVEDLEEYNGKTIEATVITADPEAKKLVLSGKERCV